MQSHAADFEELKRRASNITIYSVRISLKAKQRGNENNEKYNRQVNPYVKSETNKSAEESMSEQKENASDTCDQ